MMKIGDGDVKMKIEILTKFKVKQIIEMELRKSEARIGKIIDRLRRRVNDMERKC